MQSKGHEISGRRSAGVAVVWAAAALALGLSSAAAVAQAAAQVQNGASSPAATGTVTGQVMAQDTQLPARFAQVTLQSVSSASGGGGGGGGFGFGGRGGGGGGSVEATTGVDGTFTAVNVAPGDYYAMASAPGYIPERSLLLARVAAGADPSDLLAQIPVVHVGVDSASSVTVTIERGGTLAGRLAWEDGSPAAGVFVSATLSGAATTSSGAATTSSGTATTSSGAAGTLPAALQGIRSPSAPAFATTDDRGAFRLSGLPTGDYLVQAMIQDRPQFGGQFGGGFGGVVRLSRGSTIRIYAPGVFHKADAKPVAVQAGAERDDLRMVIDLRGLHTVSGHATSTAAGQNIGSGRVSLVDSSDSSLNLSGSIDGHGDFTVPYVPPGSYTLRILGASTQEFGGFRGRGSSQTPSVTFQQFTEPVSVSDSDVSGVSAALTPAQNPQ